MLKSNQKIEFSRFGYNSFGIPSSAVCQINNYQFLYIVPKNADELDRIEIYDLNQFPAGYGTNNAEPFDVVEYNFDEIKSYDQFQYALLTIEYYAEVKLS